MEIPVKTKLQMIGKQHEQLSTIHQPTRSKGAACSTSSSVSRGVSPEGNVWVVGGWLRLKSHVSFPQNGLHAAGIVSRYSDMLEIHLKSIFLSQFLTTSSTFFHTLPICLGSTW